MALCVERIEWTGWLIDGWMLASNTHYIPTRDRTVTLSTTPWISTLWCIESQVLISLHNFLRLLYRVFIYRLSGSFGTDFLSYLASTLQNGRSIITSQLFFLSLTSIASLDGAVTPNKLSPAEPPRSSKSSPAAELIFRHLRKHRHALH